MIGAIGSEFGEVQQQRQRREGGVMNPKLKKVIDLDTAQKDEIDRLRAVNAELLAALRRGCESLEDAIRTTDEQVPAGWTKYNCESLEMMRAAIARAEVETKDRAG